MIQTIVGLEYSENDKINTISTQSHVQSDSAINMREAYSKGRKALSLYYGDGFAEFNQVEVFEIRINDIGYV